MPFKLSPWHSLKTRVTLLTLIIFVVSLLLLAFYTSRMLRSDLQVLLSAQQFSAVSVVASHIEQNVTGRIDSLQRVSKRIKPEMMGKPTMLQQLLDEHVVTQSLFSAGVFVLDVKGDVVAEAPHSGRIGGNFRQRDDVTAALETGQPRIGQPHLSVLKKNPEFGISVPVRDDQGRVIGILRGEIDLNSDDLFSEITANRYGQTGMYLLVSRATRMVITSSDKWRVLDPVVAAGQNPVIDRFMQGFEGSTVFIDPYRIEMLASVKGIHSANWYVVATVPTAEAFAPIAALQQRMALAAILITMLAVVLTWWLLRRELSPLTKAARSLTALGNDQQFPSNLVIDRQDEVGQLIAGFNDLLRMLQQRENLLRQILDTASVAIFVLDSHTRIVQANQRMAEMFGTPTKQLVGTEYGQLLQADQRLSAQQNLQSIFSNQGLAMEVERRCLRADDSEFWVRANARSFYDNSAAEVRLVCTMADITQRKAAQEELAASEEKFRTLIEESPVGIAVHRAGTLIYVNPAAAVMLGADSPVNLVAKAVFDFIHPDCHAAALASVDLARSGQSPKRSEKFLKLDGSVIEVEVQDRVIAFDGLPTVRSSFRDVTQESQARQRLKLAANVFTHAREGILITDANVDIIDVNTAFTAITGYARADVLGKNPRLLKSGRQSAEFYVAMWRELTEKCFWHGEIWNQRKDGGIYPEMLNISVVTGTDGQIEHYVALFSDITDIKQHQHELEHIAHFDALTNLPNRVLLADRLQQGLTGVQRREQVLALVYLDLDGFKAINDHHSHEAGDLLLITLASRMKQALREGDTLARIGGDEFVAVLLDLSDRQAAVPLLQRLLAATSEPLCVGELVLQVSASLGVTFYPQAELVEADQLLRQADQAMYQAKLAGKNRFHFFDAEHDRSVRGQHETLERIRQALTGNQFVLYYQPKVNLRTGAVIGAEALIRWQHPEQGLLLPAMFLPVVEDHPLAIEVGEWVIASALAQIDCWHQQGLNLTISVNVGARQLQQSNFVQRLRELLAAQPRVNPTRLEIEVLETSAMEDLARVATVIEECQQLGIRFAMDDFGTGYSSLTYLKRLHVAVLKIDQTFVRDMLDNPDSRAILQGIVGLARAFEREVIAEGVETMAHGEALLQLGCELAQGFGIARPMPAQAFPAWVAQWQADAARLLPG